MVDQRRSPRVPVNIIAEYKSSHVRLDGRVVNLSQGGLFFRSKRQAAHAVEGRVSLTLPERAQPLELVGDVAWITSATPGGEAGMGIRFRDVPLLHRILLANFLIHRICTA